MADTPQQPQESQPAAPEETANSRRSDRRTSTGRRLRDHPIKLVIFLIVLVGAAIGGYRLWNYLESYESTDDAEIDGDIYAVTSRIAGTVKAVYVEDNQASQGGPASRRTRSAGLRGISGASQGLAERVAQPGRGGPA